MVLQKGRELYLARHCRTRRFVHKMRVYPEAIACTLRLMIWTVSPDWRDWH